MKKSRHPDKVASSRMRRHARLLRHTRNGIEKEVEKTLYRTRPEQSFTEAESLMKAKFEHIAQGG